MGLTVAVQEQIRRFVVAQVSADDLSDWLSAHAQQILDAGEAEARRLMDLTFSLLEDEIQGHRSDEDVRSILAREVPLTVTVASPFAEAQTGAYQLSTMAFTMLHVAADVPPDGRTTAGNPPLTEPLRGLLPAG